MRGPDKGASGCRRSSLLRIGASLLAAVLSWALAIPLKAHAHAVLLESAPAAGARLSTSPPEFRLRFNEPVRLLAVRLLNARGEEHVLQPRASLSGEELVFVPAEPLPAELYTLSWQVVSDDGHPVGGSLRFALGVDPPPAVAHERWAWPTPSFALVVRPLLLTSIFAATGLTVARLWFADALSTATVRASERVLVMVASLAVVSAFAQVLAQGFALVGEDIEGVLAALAEGLASASGVSALSAAVAVLASVSALIMGPGGPGGVVAALAAIAGTAALAFAGHAITAPPRVLGIAALAVHLVLAALWFGALLLLWRATRHLKLAQLSILLRRFSSLALPLVIVLLACGLLLTWRQLASFSALFTTAYGLILSAKVAAIIAVLLIALHNRVVLTPALACGDAGARARLQRNLVLELLGLALVVSLASALSFTPPPRALAQAQAAAARAQLREVADEAGRRARISLQPGQVGWNQIAVSFLDAVDKPLKPLAAEVLIESEAQAIEPTRVVLTAQGERWVHNGPELSLPGSWRIVVEALLDSFTKARFEAEFALK